MSASQGQSLYKISTAFEKQLDAPILPGLAVVGRFLLTSSDPAVLSAARAPPAAPCLAVASSGQKVIVHNNNSNAAAAKRSAKRGEKTGHSSAAAALGGDEAALRTFSFGKEPTALAAGPMNRTAAVQALRDQDALLFGAATSLLAYDIDQNRQYFYKDVEDGVRAVVSGAVETTGRGSGEEAPVLAVVGGNCSVYGFDGKGAERFWTVTGDQVTAMMMLPWDGPRGSAAAAVDGPPALVAASEDYEIRVFKGEEAVGSIMEVSCVRQLVPLWRPQVDGSASTDAVSRGPSSAAATGRFAYLLDNGTVGVYQNTERMWRVKSKCLPVSAAFCDVDCDGVAELVIGYDNGRVEVRSDVRAGSGNKGGEVVFRDDFSVPVAAVLSEDYRQDGRALPMVCTVDGSVKGLTLLESKMEEAEDTRDSQALEVLAQQRAVLAAQLASLEEQLALQKQGQQDLTMPEAGLEVQCTLAPNFTNEKLDIVFSLKNAPSDTVIHSCVLCASSASAFSDADADKAAAADLNTTTEEGDDCAKCFFAEEPSATLVCAVPFLRDTATDVTASVAVGSAFAENYQVHELRFPVPTFAAYQLPGIAQERFPQLSLAFRQPAGYVQATFAAPLRMAALESWMRQAFSVPPDYSFADATRPSAAVLHVEALSMRGGGAPLSVEVAGAGPDGSGTVTVRAETMSCCGDVISSLEGIPGGVAEDGAAPVETRCEFPEELQAMQELLAHVDELNAVRMKLSTDVADAATVVKTLLVRAEDARLLGDMASMRKGYASLYDVNKELVSENIKRANNYEDLKKALKTVNAFIQKVGRLRFTSAQRSAAVTACRNALKANKTSVLLDIVRFGNSE